MKKIAGNTFPYEKIERDKNEKFKNFAEKYKSGNYRWAAKFF